MKKLLLILSLVAGALVLATLLVLGRDLLGAGRPGAGAASEAAVVPPPWQVETLGQGRSRVAGMVLAPVEAKGAGPQDGQGPSTLADAQLLWPQQMEVAIVAAPGEAGALEALVDPAQLGGITGKLVISLGASGNAIEGMKARAAKVDFMESTTRKFTLSAQDLAEARQAPVTGLAFVPQAQLDEETVLQRFGQPAEQLPGEQGVQHHLYPHLGLDIALHPKGKEVLQYVAPAQFEQRLAAPLRQRPVDLTPPAAPPDGTGPTAR